MPERSRFWSAAALILLPLCAQAAPEQVQPGPSDAERALARSIIPSLDDGTLIAGERTALGTPALELPAATERWGLLRVDPPELRVAPGAEALVIVWLLPLDAEGRVPNFVCRDCVAIGVPAIVRGGEDGPVAVAERPIRAGSHEDVRPAHPLKVGGAWYQAVIRRFRQQGVQAEEVDVYRHKGGRLVRLGTIPVLATNEGACGRLDDVAERGRPIGRPGDCDTVYRFEAELSASKKGFVAKEVYREARAKKKYAILTKAKTVRYKASKARLAPSGASLRAKAPEVP
jgi:hypothetical protein